MMQIHADPDLQYCLIDLKRCSTVDPARYHEVVKIPYLIYLHLFYCTLHYLSLFGMVPVSVADPDPGSGAFLTLGSGIRDPEKVLSGSRIPNPYF
jgi:hypothetical protein